MTIGPLKVAAAVVLVQLVQTMLVSVLATAVAFEMNEHKSDNFLYRSYSVETLTFD